VKSRQNLLQSNMLTFFSEIILFSLVNIQAACFFGLWKAENLSDKSAKVLVNESSCIQFQNFVPRASL